MTENVSDKTNTPTPHRIEAEFYSSKGGEHDQLINNDDPNLAQDGRSRWYVFSFEKPVYLTGLSVDCDGYESWHSFELVIEFVDGTRREEKISVEKGSVSLKTGKLSSGFRFRPESRRNTSTKLERVVAVGYTLDEFHKLEKSIHDIEKKSEELERREIRFNNLSGDIAGLREEKTSLDSEIGKSRAEQEQLTSSISQGRADFEVLVASRDSLKLSIGELRDQLNDLKNDVSAGERNRDELVKELRLFPSEIAGFVREGNRNMMWYLLMSLPFIIILYIVLNSLFSNSIDLTQLWKKDQGVDVWTIFLTRIPFVVVAVTLIEACGYLVGRLFFEIVRINRQRLEFSQLSIIAKDVSTASSSGIDGMSVEKIYEQETMLKMQLLREHMKNHVGPEFEYKGSPLVSALVGVAEKLFGVRKSNE